MLRLIWLHDRRQNPVERRLLTNSRALHVPLTQDRWTATHSGRSSAVHRKSYVVLYMHVYCTHPTPFHSRCIDFIFKSWWVRTNSSMKLNRRKGRRINTRFLLITSYLTLPCSAAVALEEHVSILDINGIEWTHFSFLSCCGADRISSAGSSSRLPGVEFLKTVRSMSG